MSRLSYFALLVVGAVAVFHFSFQHYKQDIPVPDLPYAAETSAVESAFAAANPPGAASITITDQDFYRWVVRCHATEEITAAEYTQLSQICVDITAAHLPADRAVLLHTHAVVDGLDLTHNGQDPDLNAAAEDIISYARGKASHVEIIADRREVAISCAEPACTVNMSDPATLTEYRDGILERKHQPIRTLLLWEPAR